MKQRHFKALTSLLLVVVMLASMLPAIPVFAADNPVATFKLGADGTATHADGSSKTTYSETVNGYTLSITGGTNMYTGARDAKGNGAIKLGTSSKAGSFTISNIPADVTTVVIYVAAYKAKTASVKVNNVTTTLKTKSDNGQYDAITVDTSTTKTISFAVSSGYRAMVNTIEFYGASCDHSNQEAVGEAKAPTCIEDGITAGSKCADCGEVSENQAVIPATGHTDANSDSKCDTCGTNLCTEHVWVDGDVITEGDCTTDRVVSQVCDNCGEPGEDRVETAPGHTEVEDEAVDPTCTEAGKTAGSHCEVCNAVIVAQTTVPALGHNYEDGVCTECGAEKPLVDTYVLVTDISSLKAGDVIVIIGNNTSNAIGTEQKTNNRASGTVVIDGNTLILDENVQVITLEAGVTDGTFAFNVGNGYLYAASSGSNHLKTTDKLDANGSWSITIADGVATIKATGTYTRNTMQYNPNNGSPLFACYASASQTALQIYKLDGAPVTPDEPTETETESVETESVETEPVETEPAKDSTLTIEEAIALGSSKEHNKYTEGKYYITGTVVKIENDTYGNTTISDGTHEILIYGTYSADGETRYDAMATKHAVGDVITVYGIIGQYNGNPQMKNGWITEFIDNTPETEETETEAPVETETQTEAPTETESEPEETTEIESAEPSEPTAFEGKYYIATIRTEGNYWYMTNALGTANTKRYQAVDSGLTELPSFISASEANSSMIFVLELAEDGKYYIYAEGIEGDAKYLGWSTGNSGILVAKEKAKQFTVDKKDNGLFNIHFTGDEERYLSLNNAAGSDYFAFYKGTQKQDLALIPVISGTPSPELPSEPTFMGWNVSLNGMITLNVQYYVPAELVENVTLTFGDKALEVKAGLNVYSYSLKPTELNTELEFVATLNGETATTNTVSFDKFVDAMAGQADKYAGLAELLTAIQNYGAAAKGEFVGTDEFFNGASNWQEATGDIFTGIHANLNENISAIFSINTDIDYTDYKVTVTLGDKTLVNNEAFTNYITANKELVVKGLAPTHLNDVLTVTVYDADGAVAAEASLTMNDYLLAIYSASDAATQNLIVALYQYGVAAENYAANN